MDRAAVEIAAEPDHPGEHVDRQPEMPGGHGWWGLGGLVHEHGVPPAGTPTLAPLASSVLGR
jgi:hypothetical protein